MSTLGFHLDGSVCRVGCSFCYLGMRGGNAAGERSLDPALLGDIVASLASSGPFRDIAVAVSEPARRWRDDLRALADAARAHGVALAVTTTPEVVAADPWVVDGASRVSLSLDPEKHRRADEALAACAGVLSRPDLEVVGLVTLAQHRADIVGAHLRDPAFIEHAGARFERRTRRAHVVDEHHGLPTERPGGARQRKGAAYVAVAATGRQAGLRRCRADAPKRRAYRDTQPPREIGGLVEPALPSP